MKTDKTYEVLRERLYSVPLPKETLTYKPISHKELVELTTESIYSSGFSLDRERYSIAKDGAVANGRFTIKDIRDDEMQLEIGWQNSYDKSLTLKFAIGTKIFICDNGSVSGDFGAFRRKHTGEIKEFAPATIVEYIKRAGMAFERMQKERDAMKEIEISERVKAELIGRMFIEEQFISSTQLNIIKNELKSPTHDYKAPNTLWELYNFTTFSMKELHPSLWMKNHIDAHKFFVRNTAISMPIPEEFRYVTDVPNQLELFDEEHTSSVMYGVDNNQ